MRLDHVKVHGLGPFRDFAVDMEQLGDAKLVAVVGQNGSGKTCLLELALPGVLFRQCPTRGSLQDLATGRDSYVEARVTNGATYTIRHSVDGVSKKSETLVLDAAGASVLPTTSVKAFDAWAARHLPTPEVLFASVFAPQGAEGFLGAKPGERKSILLRTLGIERYEALSEKAREHARSVKAAVDLLLARIDDERHRGGDVDATEQALAALRGTAADAEAALADARGELELARSGAPALELARREAQAVREKRREIGLRIAAKDAEVAAIELKVRNNRAVLADAETIRAAKARTDDLTAELARLGEESKRLEDRRLGAIGTRDEHAARERGARQRAQAARDRAARARARLADRARIEKAVAAVPDGEESVRKAQDAEVAAAAALESVRTQRIAGADERIEHLRGGLRGIAGTPDYYSHDGGVRGIAERTLQRDDHAVTLASELPARLRAAEEAHRAARAGVAMGSQMLADVRALAARAGELDAAAREASQATEDAQAADRESEQAALARSRAAEDALQAEREVEACLQRRRAAEAEKAKLDPAAAKAGPLANAEGRLAELDPALATATTERRTLAATLEATPEPPAVPTPPDIAGLDARLVTVETAAKSANACVTLATERLARARESFAVVEALDEERVKLEEDLADWTRLGADLGRDGLQAMEIDAAGPTLTELCNDLLSKCFGTRWTISIETTRPSADGKRLLEGCEVRVIDTEKGRDAEASTFSGGERVVLGESLSLALSMLACQRTGLRGVTIVRDESGAALDPSNARAYIAMLRRAAELVGASRVLFVSHVPEVIDLADARIDVKSGGAVS